MSFANHPPGIHSTFKARQVLIGLCLILLLSLGCEVSFTTGKNGDQSPTALDMPWYQVQFTAPNTPQAKTLRGGPDRDLADGIRAARVSVDAAIYELDLWSIRDALLQAHQRGLSVRIVAESDYLDHPEMLRLIEAGIPVREDGSESLMHNKFMIIDRQQVWTGSMNYTLDETYRNNNNLIRLRSSKLAVNYTAEFDEMFVDNQFSFTSPANTPFPSFSLDGTRLEVLFSPDDGIQAHLVELLSTAHESIYFMAFSFTSDELATTVLARAKMGVKVLGVMDSRQVGSNVGSEYDTFTASGLDVRLDGNPNSMHHKVMIIDRKIVITGSYNFTNNAEKRNDENLLVIYNAEIAAIYLQEFQRVFDEAQR